MWLGIDAPAWVQLWSGAIGSFVAAILGGVTALVVVRLTNEQQRKNAERDRVVAAVADLVAEIQVLRSIFDAGDDSHIEDRYLRMKAAVIRLRMASSGFRQVSHLLEQWTYELRRQTLLFDRADTATLPEVAKAGELIDRNTDFLQDELPELVTHRGHVSDESTRKLDAELRHSKEVCTALETAVERRLDSKGSYFMPPSRRPS